MARTEPSQSLARVGDAGTPERAGATEPGVSVSLAERRDGTSTTAAPARSRRVGSLIDLPSVALALLLGVFVVVGTSYDATDSAEWFSSSLGAAAGSAASVVLLAVVLYIPIRLGYAFLDQQWDRRADDSSAPVIPMRTAVRRWLIPTVAVVAAGWLSWYVVHYPGSVDSDTVTQMLQWLGLIERTDHHPWFDTAVFGWFWDLGAGLGDYSLGLFAFLTVQILAMALGVGLVISYLGRLGLPKIWRWVLTGFVAVFPPFAQAVAVMSKDSFAAIFWLPFFILYVEALRTRGRVLAHPWVAASALAIIIPLVLAKRTNAYLLVLCVIVLLIISARGQRLRLVAGTGVVLAITNVVWPLIVLPALDIKPGTMTDMLSVPVQQTARTVATHGSSIPEEEREAIDAVLRYDGLAEAYVPRRSDSVKGRWNNEASTEQVIAYGRVWLAQLARYPGTYFSATANNTYEYFAPVSPITFQGDLNLDRYIDHWHGKSVEGTSRAQIEAVASSLRSPAFLDNARDAVNRFSRETSDNFLASKALYSSWIPLLALVFAARRRSWLHALATVPLFVNLAFLVAGPVALPRYMYPMFFGGILVVGLMLVPVRWESSVGDRRASDSRGSW